MPDKIGAGDLDRRIVILKPEITFNEFNDPVESFVELMRVAAKRSDVSTTEALRAQEIGAELTARFTIRWSVQASAVDARHRVRFGGKDYNITGIREREDRERWLEINAVVRAEAAVDYDSGSP